MAIGSGVTCWLLGEAWVVEFGHGVGWFAGATVERFPSVVVGRGVAATGIGEKEMSVDVWLFGDTTLVAIGKGAADEVGGRGVAATGIWEKEMSADVWLFGETTLVAVGRGAADEAGDTVPG